MKQPLVSIIVVTYNSQPYIKECLQSIKKIQYSNVELIIVDNNSTDNTVALATQLLKNARFPSTIKTSTQNDGYAQANNDAAVSSKGKYIFIVNPDTRVSESVLEALVFAAEKNKYVAALQPTVRLLNKPSLINLTGKVTHFLGFDWIKDYQKKQLPPAQILSSFSGSGVLIRKEVFIKLGGYDPFYFMYFEDSDLSWRLRLAGYSILYVPESLMYHDYQFVPQRATQTFQQKLFYAERNRIITLIKNYSGRSLCLIVPMFLVFELALLVFLTLKGLGKEKIASYWSIIINLKKILRSRQRTQQLRQLDDKKVSSTFLSSIDFQEFRHPVVAWILNPLMNVYWRVIRTVL